MLHAVLSAQARVAVVTGQTQEDSHPEAPAGGWVGGWLPPPFMNWYEDVLAQ